MTETTKPTGLLALIAPIMIPDCYERTADTETVCYVYGLVSGTERLDDAPAWVRLAWPTCQQVVEPGANYLECHTRSSQGPDVHEYCASCVATGIPLGSAAQ